MTAADRRLLEEERLGLMCSIRGLRSLPRGPRLRALEARLAEIDAGPEDFSGRGRPGVVVSQVEEARAMASETAAAAEAKIFRTTAEAGLGATASESVHMIVGSPPYDAVRDYHGNGIDLVEVGREAARVLVPGGVAAMVIQDQTRDGHKTLTTFRTAVEWVDAGKDAGFGLFECLVWTRSGQPGAWWNRRFRVDHEYVLIFSKGKKPRVFDKTHMMIPSAHAGKPIGGWTIKTDGSRNVAAPGRKTAETKCPGTVIPWPKTCSEARDADRFLKRKHPATFSQTLVSDLVRCFTEPGDVVVDPFMGSGTTLVECSRLRRRSIGFDPSAEYCELARARLALS